MRNRLERPAQPETDERPELLDELALLFALGESVKPGTACSKSTVCSTSCRKTSSPLLDCRRESSN